MKLLSRCSLFALRGFHCLSFSIRIELPRPVFVVRVTIGISRAAASQRQTSFTFIYSTWTIF